MNQPHKKLLIIGPVPPPFAGPEIGTKTLLDSPVLNEAYEVIHLNTTVRKSNTEKGKFDAQMVIAFMRYLLSLIRILVQQRPNFVLYCPTTASLKGWTRDGSTILLCKMFATKLFMQFRGGHFRLFLDSLAPIPRWIIRRLLGMTHKMLAQSQRLERQFDGILPDAKVGRFPNSIAADFFSNYEGLDRTGRTGPVTVLFVGHLSVAKGYCDLLEAVPSLCADNSVRFHFIGAPAAGFRNIRFNQATGEPLNQRDPENSFQRYVVETGCEANVESLGERVEGEAKLRAFENADIFVSPSYSEGFSMSILEGMSSGLPVIATRVGAAPDIIQNGENGFLIDPGDVEQLTECLRSLISDADRRLAIGNAARATCRDNYQVDHVSRRLIDILETEA